MDTSPTDVIDIETTEAQALIVPCVPTGILNIYHSPMRELSDPLYRFSSRGPERLLGSRSPSQCIGPHLPEVNCGAGTW